MKLQTYLQDHYRPRTAHQYYLDIMRYQRQISNHRQAGYSQVLAHLGNLRDQGLKGGTVTRVLAAVKAYYDWLQQTHQRGDHPCKYVRLRYSKDQGVNTAGLFSPAALERLMEDVLPQTGQGRAVYKRLYYRNKLIVSLLIYQGLATQNIINLETKDIGLESATIYIRATHQLNARMLGLHPRQVMLISHYLTRERPGLLKQPTDKLLLTKRGLAESGCGIRKVIEAKKHLFSDKTLSAQTIRQSVLVNLFKTGKDTRVVQVFAGHKQASSTERYKQTHIEELKAAVMKRHPLG